MRVAGGFPGTSGLFFLLAFAVVAAGLVVYSTAGPIGSSPASPEPNVYQAVPTAELPNPFDLPPDHMFSSQGAPPVLVPHRREGQVPLEVDRLRVSGTSGSAGPDGRV